jgi:hypothetical protein
LHALQVKPRMLNPIIQARRALQLTAASPQGRLEGSAERPLEIDYPIAGAELGWQKFITCTVGDTTQTKF